MRKWFLLLPLALVGCAGQAEVIDALAKDPATASVVITTVYGTVRICRTNLAAGKVSCTGDGLTIESTPAQASVPIVITPSPPAPIGK